MMTMADSQKTISITGSILSLSRELCKIVREWDTSSGPPSPKEKIDWLYKEHNVKWVIDWLKVNQLVDCAKSLESALAEPRDEFMALNSRAYRIISDNGRILNRHSAIRQALEILMDEAKLAETHNLQRQFASWKKQYDDLGESFDQVRNKFRDASEYLNRVGVILRTKAETDKQGYCRDDNNTNEAKKQKTEIKRGGGRKPLWDKLLEMDKKYPKAKNDLEKIKKYRRDYWLDLDEKNYKRSIKGLQPYTDDELITKLIQARTDAKRSSK
jgi:hypothetical protein